MLVTAIDMHITRYPKEINRAELASSAPDLDSDHLSWRNLWLRWWWSDLILIFNQEGGFPRVFFDRDQ